MDPRPLRLIDKADTDDATKASLRRLAEQAGGLAEAAGRDLQFEFGKTHVAFIVACNQFLRIHRSGDHAGAVECWLPEGHGIEGTGASVSGGVFAMFGWRTVPLHEGEKAVEQAFARALDATAQNLM